MFNVNIIGKKHLTRNISIGIQRFVTVSFQFLIIHTVSFLDTPVILVPFCKKQNPYSVKKF